MTPIEAAVAYCRRGWVPIPLRPREKRPFMNEWPTLRPTEDDVPALFHNGCNVGLSLGPSQIVDIDLDCEEAVTLAPALLPPTPLRFGRADARASHWLYACEGADYEKLPAPLPGTNKHDTLVELRSGPGLQTMMPPSIHPTGQVVRWERGVDPLADPATVDASVLSLAVRRLAAACLLLREGWDVASAVDAVRQPEAPSHLPDFAHPDHEDLVRRWCGWETTTAPRGTTTAPTTNKTTHKKPPTPTRYSDAALDDFNAAKSAYLRDHPGDYSSRGGECPVCGSSSGFKAANEDGKWSCFSDRHLGVAGPNGGPVGVAGKDHHTGDQLDLDAFLAGRTAAEHLRETGYLKKYAPTARRPEPPPYDGPDFADAYTSADHDGTADHDGADTASAPPPHGDPPTNDFAEAAATGLVHLRELAAHIEVAQDEAERAALLFALMNDGDVARCLGFAHLRHEREVEAVLVALDPAFRPKTPLRKFEAQVRAARKRAAEESADHEQRVNPTPPPEHDVAPLERGDELEVANRAIDDYLGPATVYDLSALHHYDEHAGCWVAYERHHTVKVITRYAGAPVYSGSDEFRALRMSNAFANGAAALVESTRRRADFFDDRATGCGFTNGFLRSDGCWMPKSADHRLLETEVLPFEYHPVPSGVDAATVAPTWHAFLRDLFLDDEDADAKIRVLHQFIGATMLGIATRYQMALLLWGPQAGNGKSTLMKVIASLFAAKSRCSIPPDIMGKTFENIPIATARINLVSDMPERTIFDTGTLKAVISGDEIQFNPKNRDPFTAIPRAGHIFAANNLPGVSDRSRGFWRRMLVLTLNRCFDKTPEEDPDIAAKVIAEAPQIAAVCLRAAFEIERGYDIPPSSVRVAGDWEQRANNVKAFTDGFRIVQLPSSGVVGPILYTAYRLYCQDTGIDRGIVGRNKFYDELRRIGWEQGGDKLRTWLVQAVEDDVAHAVERAQKA